MPGLLGPIVGPFICLAGNPIEGDGVSPHNLGYFKNCYPIIIVSTMMKDTARRTSGNKRINGIFIIEVEVNVDTPEKLATVNKNVITAYAGPRSLVLVRDEDKFLFLEGISMKGLVEKVPEFGESVDLNIDRIVEWGMENVHTDSIVDITECKAMLGDKSFTMEEIILKDHT